MEAEWHLAQVNIARALEPLDSPALAEFVANLEPVNELAEAASGFVWRLQDDSGDATSIRVFDDDLMIVNLSVWESIEALWDFVYSGRHLEVMRRRREWFVRMTAESYLALWWVRAGENPSEWDGKARVEHIREHGPTPDAFTFKKRFQPNTNVPAASSASPPGAAGSTYGS